jgi:hypothetical protein
MSPSLRAFLVVLGLLGATEVAGQEAVTALDRTDLLPFPVATEL